MISLFIRETTNTLKIDQKKARVKTDPDFNSRIKNLTKKKLNDNNVRNVSIECVSPSKLINFDEHKSYQKSGVIFQWVNT